MRKLLWVGLLGMGCITTRFEQFDASFDPVPSTAEPRWIEGGLMPSEYLMVGVIDVQHRQAAERQQIVSKARTEARALGCNMVMPEPPHEELTPPPGHTRFLCAVPRPGYATSREH